MTAACAGPSARRRIQPRSIPTAAAERGDTLDVFARQLLDALRGTGVGSVLADGNELDVLLASDARSRVQAERGTYDLSQRRAPWSNVWQGRAYQGFCAQGARQAPAGGALGLAAPAWVMDRMLVVVHEGRLRSAAWVEGSFVFTDRGWRAIAVSRVEAPRPDHADLELAPCDVQRGFR